MLLVPSSQFPGTGLQSMKGPGQLVREQWRGRQAGVGALALWVVTPERYVSDTGDAGQVLLPAAAAKCVPD